MTTAVANKPVAYAALAQTPHPFEAGVRDEIGALRAKLTELRGTKSLDTLSRSQVKNLEAQLSKKKVFLASLTGPADRAPEAPLARKASGVSSKSAPQAVPSQSPAADTQSFGALGARLKGRLAPGIKARLAPGAPPTGETF